MSKKIGQTFIICLLVTIIFFMIISSNQVIESVTFSISIWKDNLFPTLFPFFIVSNLLVSYGFINIIGKILNPVMKIFNLSGNCGFVLAISLFSGFPSGAKYTSDLVERKIISNEEGNRLLTFTHYSNPLFIIGMIGTILLNNKKAAIIILIAHIISGILTGIILNYNKNNNIEIKNSFNIKNNDSLGVNLKNSIFDSLNTMFLLLGIITIFLIVTTFINSIINLPPIANTILSGILEMTQGVKNASLLDTNLMIKTLLITGIISFGGLSVHIQVISIISNTKLKYKSFLIARIIHSILAIGFAFILFMLL